MKLIKNCNLINMAGIYMNTKDILIEDGKIKEIAPSISTDGLEPHEIYDADNQIATPGFVDIHNSVGVISQKYRFEGNDGNEVSGPILPQLRAIDAIDITDEGFQMAVNGGVTTVITGPGDRNVIGGTCAAFKTAGKSFGDRIISEEIAFYADLSESPRSHYGSKNIMPKTRMGSAYLLREALLNAREYHRVKDKEDIKFDMKMDSLSRVFDGMILKIHADHYTDILTAVRICDEFDIKGILVGCSDLLEALPSIGDSSIDYAVGPLLVSPRGYAHRNRNAELAGKLQDKDLDFAVVTGHPQYPIEYANVQLAYLGKRGMEDLMTSITLTPAKIMGIDDRVGTIEVGKDADIVIWDKEPFDVYASVIDVFIDGDLIER